MPKHWDWHIERDSQGVPERMIWIGVDMAAEPRRCEHGYTDRAGRIYGCSLLADHEGSKRGKHNFVRIC